MAKDILEDDLKVNELREKIMRDYTGTVFRDEVWPNPPVRNPLGQAKIELKQGIVPVKQRPFVIQGERLIALRKIIEEFEKQGLIEEAVSPWMSPAIQVKNKEAGK